MDVAGSRLVPSWSDLWEEEGGAPIQVGSAKMFRSFDPLHPTHSMRIILAKMQIFTMAAAETKSGHDGRTADLDQLEDDNSFPKCVEFLARSMFCAFKFSNVFFIFVTLFHLAWFLGRLGSSSQTLKLQAFYHWIIHACQTKLHNPEAQNPTSHIDRSRRLRIL